MENLLTMTKYIKIVWEMRTWTKKQKLYEHKTFIIKSVTLHWTDKITDMILQNIYNNHAKKKRVETTSTDWTKRKRQVNGFSYQLVRNSVQGVANEIWCQWQTLIRYRFCHDNDFKQRRKKNVEILSFFLHFARNIISSQW